MSIMSHQRSKGTLNSHMADRLEDTGGRHRELLSDNLPIQKRTPHLWHMTELQTD